MSQKSTERLRDYLAQLPPQSQALLMRELERAVERGDDVAVANLVLEQLRKIVRGAEEDERIEPRSDDPARLLFRPLEPFLAETNFPTRPGQLRRASLLPIWQWLAREGAPQAARDFEATLGVAAESGPMEIAARKFQLAAAEAILKIAGPSQDDRQRALSRVGPPSVVEDLLPIGLVLQAREALETLGSRLPSQIRVFSDSQIASAMEALKLPSLQTPQLLPFALSLIAQRLAAPWQIIRLAIKMAASDDELRVAATPYGIAVTIALHDLSFVAACLRTDIRRGHFEYVSEQLKTLHDGVRGLRTELGPPVDVGPRRHLQRAAIGDRQRAGPGPPHPAPARRQGHHRRRQDRPVRGRGRRRPDRFRRGVPHLRQRARDQRGDAADLLRPAALCRAVDRGAGAVAARRRCPGPVLPPAAGQGRDPLLRGAVRPRLRVADEPRGGECGDRRAEVVAGGVALPLTANVCAISE
jgi:hypothetical protein